MIFPLGKVQCGEAWNIERGDLLHVLQVLRGWQEPKSMQVHMAFGEVLKPHNGISSLPGRMRESLGSGEGEPGRGGGLRKGRHLRRAEKQYRPDVWWRSWLTFIENFLWAAE